MIYLDTSCLIKLIRIEEESDAVAEAVAPEAEVLVSSLGELEALVQLKAGYLGGSYSQKQWKTLETHLSGLRNEKPFSFRPVPSAAWETAFQQHHSSQGEIHCRSLDRLHLAVMECLGVRRLMTHDARQSKAARGLGFEVINPGR